MFPSSLNRIAMLAAEVRMATEDLAIEIHGDNPRAVYVEDMNGMCAIASYALREVLIDHEYDPKMILAVVDKTGFSHCWVELDGWVIDITATQFGPEYPNVHIVPIGDEDPMNQIYVQCHRRDYRAVHGWGLTSPDYHMGWLNDLIRRLRNH